LPGQLRFALEELLELLLLEVLELLAEAAAVLHPQADGLFQGARDVQQSALALVPGVQVQGTVQLALLAAARGFATGTGAFDQTAAQERLLGNQLGESGTRVAFWGRTVRAVAHGKLPCCSDMALYAQNEWRRQARQRMRICSAKGRPR
jgi:hypothetical protein